jgi:uncharacterized UBP type Zn finger protein
MKNEKKETAVDWLFNQMFDPTYPAGEQMEWLEQAKEMEENQIKSIFCDGLICGIENPKVTPKQYYKQIWEGGEK